MYIGETTHRLETCLKEDKDACTLARLDIDSKRYTHVFMNCVRTITLTPYYNSATEWNVNFLTATVLMLQSNNTILKINHPSSTDQDAIVTIITPIHRLPYWYVSHSNGLYMLHRDGLSCLLSPQTYHQLATGTYDYILVT